MLTVFLTIAGGLWLAFLGVRIARYFADRSKAAAGFLVRDVNGKQMFIDADGDDMLADAVAETLRTGKPVVANRDEQGYVTVRVLGDDQ